MLHKTQAIVLRYIKYGESSIILKAYTAQFGLQSYLVHQVRSEKARHKAALFQPLSLLEMVVYHKKQKNSLQRLAEVRCTQPCPQLLQDMHKASVVMFLSEILYKVLPEEGLADEALFAFLEEAICSLDSLQKGLQNFSLQFLLKLSQYLGFYTEDSLEIYQQLYEHRLLPANPTQFGEAQALLQALAVQPFAAEIAMPGIVRQQLIDHLLLYYQLHIEGFGKVKSLAILREILA
jgi:DNA repair protein RecO (recombination protein O)